MKILAIRLKNLTSIEGTVEVDLQQNHYILLVYLPYQDLRVPVSLLY